MTDSGVEAATIETAWRVLREKGVFAFTEWRDDLVEPERSWVTDDENLKELTSVLLTAHLHLNASGTPGLHNYLTSDTLAKKWSAEVANIDGLGEAAAQGERFLREGSKWF